MWKNSRQTFINAINRNYHFAHSDRLKEVDNDYIKERWELLKSAYTSFIEHHNGVVSHTRAEKLKEEEDLATQMEDVYVQTVTKFRKQIALVDEQQAKQRENASAQKMQDNEVQIMQPDTNSEDTGEEDGLKETAFKVILDSRSEERAHANVRSVVVRAANDTEPVNFSRQIEQRNDISRFTPKTENTREIFERERISIDLRRQLEQNRMRWEQNQRQMERIRVQEQVSRERQARQERSTNRFGCHMCGSFEHPLNRCTTFLDLTVEERNSEVHRLNLCRNCFAQLNPDFIHQCNTVKHGPCWNCYGKFHNSLLCFKNERRYR